MKITGKANHITREHHTAPIDGIHKVGQGGKIKGLHCIEIDGEMIPKGMNCIFYRGVKIFYSLRWFCVVKKKFIDQEIRNLKKLYKKGLAPRPGDRVNVDLDFTYMGKRVKKIAPGIEVEAVDYPKKAVEDLAKGRPYDWSAVNHPNHTPAGFLVFKDKVRKTIKKLKLINDGSFKIGDVLWDRRDNKWKLVDCS